MSLPRPLPRPLSRRSSGPARSRPSLAAAALAVMAVVVAGCGVTTDDEPQAQETEPTATTSSPTETVTVTESPTPSETTPTPSEPTSSAPSPTAQGPEGSLLSAAELPGLNDTLRWTETRTGPAGADAFGLCAKFDLASIGAETVVQRDFTSGGDTGAQQVATFADAQTAVRASKVLQSWHATCRERARGRAVDVRPIESVAVPRGTGSYYVVSYRSGGRGHFHAFGTALSGTRMTVLKTDQTGQDRNHEPGQDPMQLAVAAASSKLGG